MDFEKELLDQIDQIKELLIAKNKSYGDSALNPLRIFSKTSSAEQIRVRIDDKISRLARGHALDTENMEDTIKDLIGYLVLLLIAHKREQKKSE